MTIFAILAAAVSVLGIATWLALLLWAARADGRDERRSAARRRRDRGPST